MPKTIIRLLTGLLLCFIVQEAAVAVEINNENFDEQYKEYLKLYSDDADKSKAFYAKSNELKHYYREKKNPHSYYSICMNEALYETEHGKPYNAVQKANDMLEEMKDEGYNGFHMVHMVLGTIFENCGYKRMAQQYYQQAIDETEGDENARLPIYSRMAYLLMMTDPNKAEYWNEMCRDFSKQQPGYHQAYLFISSAIKFAVGNKAGFYDSYKAYNSYHEQHNELDNFGKETMEIMKLAFDGKTTEALNALSRKNPDVNEIVRNDMRIIIYQRIGKTQQAFSEWQQRSETVDSLNSNMLFNNLNEINAATGIAKIEADASKKRETMWLVLLALAAVCIALMGVWIIMHRRMSNNLKEKSEQLSTALAMAEESDRMKTEFIRNVSHEIRTPLNAINGFNDLLNTPGMELTEDLRAELLNGIKDNVKSITDIVDKMLQLADKDSNEFAHDIETIYCNQTLSAIIYKYRSQVKSDIDLQYTSDVINRFSIRTNKEAITKILDHLIQNAIKFTQKGSITLHCEESYDHQQVLISLADTGKGIPAEQQDKVFDGFHKVDSFQQGIGLGLAVSKKITQKLGGDLTIDKNYTGGTRFVLQLPNYDPKIISQPLSS